jgi:hypothetical protein
MPVKEMDTSTVFLLSCNLCIFTGKISFAKILIIINLLNLLNFYVELSLIRKDSLKTTIFTG